MQPRSSGQTNPPSILHDISHEFGQDIQASPTGDLAIVSGLDRSKQRVLRRLLTAINGYIWHSDYGAGIPSYIGKSVSDSDFIEIKSLIKSQIGLEQSVLQIPAPIITLQTIAGGLYCQIDYLLNPTQQPITLNFQVGI